MKRLLAALLAFLFTGCGYFVAGTWTDDPENWKRAFSESRPADGISIVHSWYMRTPHFTAEFAWFFELTLTAEVKQKIASNPEFSKLAPKSLDELQSRMYHERPVWFSPRPLEAFDIFESQVLPHFLILIEKNGHRSFWTSCQL